MWTSDTVAAEGEDIMDDVERADSENGFLATDLTEYPLQERSQALMTKSVATMYKDHYLSGCLDTASPENKELFDRYLSEAARKKLESDVRAEQSMESLKPKAAASSIGPLLDKIDENAEVSGPPNCIPAYLAKRTEEARSDNAWQAQDDDDVESDSTRWPICVAPHCLPQNLLTD